MTYKNLKKFLSTQKQPNDEETFDLMPDGIKSKVIFAVGENASNTASFLASVMTECGIPYSRYINSDTLELKNRFILNGSPVPIEKLCQSADALIKRAKKNISSESLLFLLALHLLEDEYMIIEMSNAQYEKIMDGSSLIPFAILLCELNDEVNGRLISLAPRGVSEIFALSQKEDYDYISSAKSKNGTRVSFVSQNKTALFKANVLGTNFYYFSYCYHIPTVDQNNILLASLAIDSARLLFSAPVSSVYKGLERAELTDDLKLFSISPNILLKTGRNNFSLPHNLKFKIITNEAELNGISENTVICGDAEFIERAKIYLSQKSM